jgi:primase-polymerase (primpol)-like protein
MERFAAITGLPGARTLEPQRNSSPGSGEVKTLNLANIPEPLAGARRWVLFKIIRQPDGSLKKIPVTIKGAMARSTSPTDWATLKEVALAVRFGVGHAPAIALGPDYPLQVLDLDHCLDARGNLTPLAQKIVSRSEGAYIERSVSGSGLHVLCWMSNNEYPCNPCPGLEVYGGAPRFIIMTGDLWNSRPTADPEFNRQLAYREAQA